MSEAGRTFGQNYCCVPALLMQPVRGVCAGSLQDAGQGCALAAQLSSTMYKFHAELQCSLSVQKEFFKIVFPVCDVSAAELLLFSSLPLQNLISEGFAVAQLVNQLHDTIVESEDYSDKQKSAMIEKLAVSPA